MNVPNPILKSFSSTLHFYPFGMLMPQRTFTSQSYRFGFNTQEKTDEIAGVGNHYTAEFWEYSPRVVHRWNLDPKPVVSISPYAIMQGNPIFYNDIFGDSVNVSDMLSVDKDNGTNYTQEMINSTPVTSPQGRYRTLTVP
jgi:hypothetical protein